MLELRPPRDWQPGDWCWSDAIDQPSRIERSDDGPGPGLRDSVWLPPLPHWLDALRAEGIFSIEFTRNPDDPANRIIRAWPSGPWRTTGEGHGPTDEEAAARCRTTVRRG